MLDFERLTCMQHIAPAAVGLLVFSPMALSGYGFRTIPNGRQMERPHAKQYH